MSDLDDLARAASGGTSGHRSGGSRPPAGPAAKPAKAGKAAKPAKGRAAPPPPAADDDGSIVYEQPPPSAGVSPMAWVGLGAGIVLVLAVAFWLVNREREPAPPPVAQSARNAGAKSATTRAALPAAPTSGPTTTGPSTNGAPGASPAAKAGAALKPATRPMPADLKDVEEPSEAIEFTVTRKGDSVEIKARNISKRGVFVRSMAFYAETNDRVQLGSVGFWLQPGHPVSDTYPIADLSSRLGEEEGVTAVIEDAEFSDKMPKELAEQAAADSGAATADEDEDEEEEEDEPPPPPKKKGKKKKKS